MVEQYDDWGDPIPRYQAPDRSIKGIVRSYYYLITRKYRSLFTTILILLCVIVFWNIPREEKVPRTDWSQFAYVQYVTDDHNLCNAYMVFEALHRHKSKAQRVLMYPQEWDLIEHHPKDRNSQLLVRAQKLYNVILKPISLIDTDGKITSPPGKSRKSSSSSSSSWSTSITKLRAFELTEYTRVLHLDSDITLLQHLDELFLLPSAPIAMPRAYWLPPSSISQTPLLTSLLLLIEPSPPELTNFLSILTSRRLHLSSSPAENYDMDLLNHRFASSALILPHKPYALLTSEFRAKDHTAYLGTQHGPHLPHHSKYTWDADRALREAKLVHFSDWPLPKPWVMWPPQGLAEMQPDCDGKEGGCRERAVWKELYSDFRRRRKDLCRVLSVPAPRWEDIKGNGTDAG